MTYINLPIQDCRDFIFEVARGNVSGVSVINKFGRAPNGLQTTISFEGLLVTN